MTRAEYEVGMAALQEERDELEAQREELTAAIVDHLVGLTVQAFKDGLLIACTADHADMIHRWMQSDEDPICEPTDDELRSIYERFIPRIVQGVEAAYPCHVRTSEQNVGIPPEFVDPDRYYPPVTLIFKEGC